MTDLRTAAQQALEALESGLLIPHSAEVFANLRAALAKPDTSNESAYQRGYMDGMSRQQPKAEPQQEPPIDWEAVAADQAMTIALMKAEPVQEPVAWRTFDGEGGYDYRTYEDNENYAAEWAQRNPRHAGWVEPLYTATPQRKPLSEEEIEKAYRHIWRSLPYEFDYTTASWIEQGIRHAERAHGIGEKE